ncbi:lysophospholipase L1-like esterase [Sphingomonas zeicaulis]|uniref:GDSL-type esterase/lipase family protein n=1 Tax=Sphingomonas zeicaulis TaxID=1632740 RepID=UPI003D22BB1F
MKAICAAITAMLTAAPLAAQPGERFGLFADPCAELPPQPAIVAAYSARAAQARAAKTAIPPRTGQEETAFREWQKQVRLADFAGLCRYRAENAKLPAATAARVVFMGDSITEGWLRERPSWFANKNRVDRGISGQTTAQMLLRFQADVIALKPKLVHILAGTNDVAGNTGPTSQADIRNNITAMVDLAEANKIRVVIGTVLPARHYFWRPEVDPVRGIADLNAWIRTLAQARKLTLIDYFAAMDDGRGGLSTADATDGVHPTPAGYAKMEALAAPAIERAGD